MTAVFMRSKLFSAARFVRQETDETRCQPVKMQCKAELIQLPSTDSYEIARH